MSCVGAEGELRDFGELSLVAVDVDHLRQAVPVAPHVHVAASDEAAGSRHWGDVPARAQADEHVLNGPLQLREQLLIRAFLVTRLGVLTVHTDQGEADTLDVDIVNLGIHEDVVDVE